MTIAEGLPTEDVVVRAGHVALHGDLALPSTAGGVVVFAHGSGSSRHSPRNRYVAGVLQRDGFGTLLLDLLTPDEEAADARTAHLRFDVPLLAERLVAVVDWFCGRPETRGLPIGLFGASTGAAAALTAAAARPQHISAVVSRGGRPDLAGDAAARVVAPTLLIVGGLDTEVIRLNRAAMRQMVCERAIEVVEGATHLFEEPGALARVADLAGAWFLTFLRCEETRRRPAPQTRP
jgi:dienelactone hydrolase